MGIEPCPDLARSTHVGRVFVWIGTAADCCTPVNVLLLKKFVGVILVVRQLGILREG